MFIVNMVSEFRAPCPVSESFFWRKVRIADAARAVARADDSMAKDYDFAVQAIP